MLIEFKGVEAKTKLLRMRDVEFYHDARTKNELQRSVELIHRGHHPIRDLAEYIR